MIGSLSLFEQPAKAAPLDCSTSSMLGYGSIYDNKGNSLAQNVWFTAFITNSDFNFKVGNNTWNQVGYAMVWGNAGFPNAITGPQKYIPLGLYYVLNIKELYRSGQNVQTDLISVTTIHAVNPAPTNDTYTPPATINTTTTQTTAGGSINNDQSILIGGILILGILLVICVSLLVRERRKKY
jgi:hypothetical protein